MDEISRVALLDARLREVKATASVQVHRISLAPGVAVGAHVHNCPVVGGIVEGSVIYQIDGEPENLLAAGDVFYEPEGVRIARFDAQDEGAVFLAYYLLSEGQQPELEMQSG